MVVTETAALSPPEPKGEKQDSRDQYGSYVASTAEIARPNRQRYAVPFARPPAKTRTRVPPAGGPWAGEIRLTTGSEWKEYEAIDAVNCWPFMEIRTIATP